MLMNSARYDLYKTFSQAGSRVLKQLSLYGYPQETTRILSKDTFLFYLQYQDILAKCLSGATTEWSTAKIR